MIRKAFGFSEILTSKLRVKRALNIAKTTKGDCKGVNGLFFPISGLTPVNTVSIFKKKALIHSCRPLVKPYL